MATVRMIIMAAALALGAGTIAFGQQTPFEPQAGGAHPNAALKEKRAEVRKKVETLRIYRMTEALALDEQTSAKVASLLGSIDRKRSEISEQNQAAVRELRTALKNPHPDENKLKTLMGKIEQGDHAMTELKQRETQGLREILTTEQQARYILFQRDFTREIRRMIAGARSDRAAAGRAPGKADQGPLR